MSRFNAVCPGCRGKFPWDPKMGLPSRCPLPDCDYTSKERDELVVSAPFIRSARMKQTDNSYRQLEQASEARAQAAAEIAGVPVSEMSHLKVTNIRDTREGEVAAIPVNNPVTQQMAMMQSRGGQAGFTRGDPTAFADAAVNGAVTVNGHTTKGIVPRAGIKAMENIQARFTR